MSGSDEALRESMRETGYLPGHPVIKDEHGIIIEGHRRDRVARELGIEPETMTITFGDSSEADIRRLQQAVFSNLGGRAFPLESRRSIAAHMVVELSWTQQAAASALGVSQKTISKDLANIERRKRTKEEKEKEEKAKEAGQRKNSSGQGRPRRRKTAEEDDWAPGLSAAQRAVICRIGWQLEHRIFSGPVSLGGTVLQVAEGTAKALTARKLITTTSVYYNLTDAGRKVFAAAPEAFIVEAMGGPDRMAELLQVAPVAAPETAEEAAVPRPPPTSRRRGRRRYRTSQRPNAVHGGTTAAGSPSSSCRPSVRHMACRHPGTTRTARSRGRTPKAGSWDGWMRPVSRCLPRNWLRPRRRQPSPRRYSQPPTRRRSRYRARQSQF